MGIDEYRDHAKGFVVFDKSQAQIVCDFIEGKVSSETILKEFGMTSSPGLDPEKDLQRAGCANQTTMLSSESLEIAGMIERSFVNRYGKKEAEMRFRSFDTICSATQDRQDAIIDLLNTRELDLMLVLGGYNSSNTGHLVEISGEHVRSFHIEGYECLISADQIKHKLPLKNEIVVTDNWLPDGPFNIGVTAGASTPNSKIGEVLYRLLGFRNVSESTLNSLVTPELEES